jgi:hypothetical protein
MSSILTNYEKKYPKPLKTDTEYIACTNNHILRLNNYIMVSNNLGGLTLLYHNSSDLGV